MRNNKRLNVLTLMSGAMQGCLLSAPPYSMLLEVLFSSWYISLLMYLNFHIRLFFSPLNGARDLVCLVLPVSLAPRTVPGTMYVLNEYFSNEWTFQKYCVSEVHLWDKSISIPLNFNYNKQYFHQKFSCYNILKNLVIPKRNFCKNFHFHIWTASLRKCCCSLTWAPWYLLPDGGFFPGYVMNFSGRIFPLCKGCSVPLKLVSTQNLRLWPYFEIGSLEM